MLVYYIFINNDILHLLFTYMSIICIFVSRTWSFSPHSVQAPIITSGGLLSEFTLEMLLTWKILAIIHDTTVLNSKPLNVTWKTKGTEVSFCVQVSTISAVPVNWDDVEINVTFCFAVSGCVTYSPKFLLLVLPLLDIF